MNKSIQKIFKSKKLIALILILAISLPIKYWYFPAGSWRYEVTITVDTPEGVKTGSAVHEISNSKGLFGFPDAGNPADIEGEAVVVDLGERGVLFALISQGLTRTFYQIFPVPMGHGGSTREGIRYYRNIEAGLNTSAPVVLSIIEMSYDVSHTPVHLMLTARVKPESYDALMQGQKANIIFADPPYNVPIDGHVGNSGKTQHREFPMASGEMTADEFTQFLITVFERVVENSTDGSIHYQCMDWRHLKEILAAGKTAGYDLKNLCVWVKDNGGMGSLYRSRHELICVFKNGTAPHMNNVELGKHGRYRTNVWEYAGVNSFGNGRMDELKLHPTVKPVPMISDALKDTSKRGDIVLDSFGGSGSTLIAAERTGRKARLIEIDPIYCDVIIRRWQELTGEEAIHAETGATFNAIDAESEAA